MTAMHDAHVGCDPRYLRATALSPSVARLKQEAYEALEIAGGSFVVDVGCGPGIDTIPLAHIVGPEGHVTGVDADAAAVDEANRAAVEAGVGAWTRHTVGDAAALELSPGEADACYSERLLQHIAWDATPRVAEELLRVVKPGGRVVVVDTDWATLSIASQDPWLERRIVQELALGFVNPYSGRGLPAVLSTAGLAARSVRTFDLQLGYDSLTYLLAAPLRRGIAARRLGASEVQRWSAALRTANDYGLFFAHVSMVMVAGRVP